MKDKKGTNDRGRGRSGKAYGCRSVVRKGSVGVFFGFSRKVR